jgi:hypothetical protein
MMEDINRQAILDRELLVKSLQQKIERLKVKYIEQHAKFHVGDFVKVSGQKGWSLGSIRRITYDTSYGLEYLVTSFCHRHSIFKKETELTEIEK